MPKDDYKHFVMLDGVLENDHSLKNEHRNMHRVKIYERKTTFMTLGVDGFISMLVVLYIYYRYVICNLKIL